MKNEHTFFEHNFQTISIEHAFDRFKSFSDFEKSFSDEMLNEDIQIIEEEFKEDYPWYKEQE